MREGLGKYINEANADTNVVGVVVCGKGGNFCAGADIKEFDSGKKGIFTNNNEF